MAVEGGEVPPGGVDTPGGGDEGEAGVPSCLLCPECESILKSAVLMPCCQTCLCRPCAFKRLAMNKKKCWLGKTDACSNSVVALNNIIPAQQYRELVQDYSNGGEKYKQFSQGESQEEEEISEVVEYMDNNSILSTHKPMLVVKKETITMEEEYSEMSNTVDTSNVKSEPNPDTGSEGISNEAMNFYLNASTSLHFNQSPITTNHVPKVELQEAESSSLLKRETVDISDDCSQPPLQFSGDSAQFSGDEELFPHPTTLPNTPSSARTEHQSSSGYWSDEGYEGSFFGKLTWDPDDPTWGQIHCWDAGDMKTAYVKRFEVKCGAETGDLVEFTLSTDSELRKVAKRVKLVEKALPKSEEDQIRSQDNLKRSVEMSSGIIIPHFNKKLKTEDIIEPDVINIQDPGVGMDYDDIAAGDDYLEQQELVHLHHQQATHLQEAGHLQDVQIKKQEHNLDFSDNNPEVKSEFANLLAMQDVASQQCNCNTKELKRCGVCAMYFLRSESQNTILEGECITFLARIDGLEPGGYLEAAGSNLEAAGSNLEDTGGGKGDATFAKHLPFPFLFNPGTIDFKLLAILGPNCLVKKISPVFSKCYVYVSLVNESDGQVNISPDSVLGVCQLSYVQANEVSLYFILEPPDRQPADSIPVTVQRKEFSRCENSVWGMAEIGIPGINYNYALVKIRLSAEYRNRFSMNKDEMTVQGKRHIWLELVPKLAGGFVNLLPVTGVIGFARPVMNQDCVNQLIDPAFDGENNIAMKGGVKSEEDDHYESMMNKLNSLTEKTGDGNEGDVTVIGNKLNVLDKDFRGITCEGVTILPNSERTVVLMLTCDDEEGGAQADAAKSLLKLNVQVTTNDEFQYYNNCYTIESQVTTVINSRCPATHAFKPAVKVIVRNIRQDVAQIPKNSPIAVVKVNKASSQNPSNKPKVKEESTQRGARHSRASNLISPPSTNKEFNPVKELDRIQRRFLRQWEKLLSEKTFEKSLTVEEKYPYFSLAVKPRIPFGLTKMKELLMRVGLNQSAKPMRVIDKDNQGGLFSCKICDQLILDRYALQDHFYSEKHKKNLKSFQVIAGLDERIYQRRPVIQELLDQLDFDLSHELVGLDLILEVLGGVDDITRKPVYHCSACGENFTDQNLPVHVLSPSHVFQFLKEHFPAAWHRFSTLENPGNWSQMDFQAYSAIIHKINEFCGIRKPGIVQSLDNLEEAVDKLPSNLYDFIIQERVGAFIKTLPQIDTTKMSLAGTVQRTRTITRIAVSLDDVGIPPCGQERVQCKITNVPHAGVVKDKFVLVSQSPRNTICAVSQSFCKVQLVDQIPCIQVCIQNTSVDSPVAIPSGTDLALVKWKK